MAYTLSLYEKAMPDDMPLPQKFTFARECGYDSVEICIDLDARRAERLRWSGRQRAELVSVLRADGFAVPTVSLSALRGCPLGLPDAAANARAIEVLERGAEFTAALGCSIMLINGYDVYDEPSTPETAARFAENIGKAAEIAGGYNIFLAIENAEREFIDSIAKAAAWVHKTGSPWLRVYGDIGNSANAMGGDAVRVLSDLESARGVLAACHLKDSLPGEYRFCRYGEGHVDFASAVPKLLEMGVGVFTAELFQQPAFDWRNEAARVNRFLRGFLNHDTDGRCMT